MPAISLNSRTPSTSLLRGTPQSYHPARYNGGMTYPNGRIPLNKLVHLGGEQYLFPGTAVRWANLVADVKANEGITLTITPGANGYRWYEKQVEAKNEAIANGTPQNAATPGYSSHGGLFEGTETCAIDVWNWSALGKDKFYSYARKHGFQPGYFSWEPWHIIDRNPWVKPTPTPTPDSEEDDMAYIAIIKKKHWYCVTGTKAHVLGAESGARQSGMPILNYVDDWAVNELKKSVSGIGKH